MKGGTFMYGRQHLTAVNCRAPDNIFEPAAKEKNKLVVRIFLVKSARETCSQPKCLCWQVQSLEIAWSVK